MHCLFPFFVVYEWMTILAEEGFPILLLLFIRINRAYSDKYQIIIIYNEK